VLVSSIVPYLLKTPDNPEGVPQTVFDQMTTAMKDDRAHFFAGFFKTFFGEGLLTKPVSDEVLEWARDTAMEAGLNPTLAAAKAFATTDFRPELTSFTMPTLVIHGTADKVVPIEITGRVAERLIPSATLLEYGGAPHGVFATHKEQLTHDLLNFLQEARLGDGRRTETVVRGTHATPA